MNPSQTAPGIGSYNNPFENIESKNEYEQPEPVNEIVSHRPEDLQEIRSGWESFYQMRTEDAETKSENNSYKIESYSESVLVESKNEDPFKPDLKPLFAMENQKGSGSLIEETGITLNPFKKLGEIGKSLFGVFSLFKEIFMDTVTLVAGKKEKKKAQNVPSDPEKAKAEAEKKAKEQKRKNNIRAFYDGLQAQSTSIASVEVVQMEVQEKANINKTAKIGHESYKGIKTSFGRLTVYAASMFEREQLDQEKKAKKIEKEQKIASIGKSGPDLGLDKVAEGGFLSSTGGQGAG